MDLNLVFLLVALILIVPNAIKVIPANSEALVMRLGKFSRVLKPGLHVSLIPFVDRIARTYSTKQTVLDIPPVTAPDQELLPLTVASEITYQVIDSQRLHASLEDHGQALVTLTHTAIKSAIEDQLFDQLLVERKEFESSVHRRLETGVRNWGIKVHGFTARTVTPPDEVIKALEERARQERARREQ